MLMVPMEAILTLILNKKLFHFWIVGLSMRLSILERSRTGTTMV